MNRLDLKYMLSYAKINNLLNKPVVEVYKLFIKDLEVFINDNEADIVISRYEGKW